MNAASSTRAIGWVVATLTALKLVINSGFRFVYPFLPTIARGLGVDLRQMGVLLSVRWGTGFALPLLVGAPRNSRRSRRYLVAGLVAFGAGALITAIAGVFIGALVGFALMGIGKPVFDVGAQTYVSERVPYRRRARALGTMEMSWAGGLLIGAPVAGWLIETWGWELPFWTFGTIALVSVAAIFLILEGTDGANDEPVTDTDQPMRVVFPFLLVVALAGLTLELVLVALGSWLEDGFGMTIAGLAGVGFLLGSAELTGEGIMVGFTDRIGKRNSFAYGLVGAAAAAVGLGLSAGSQLWGLLSLFLLGVTIEFAFISGIPLASEYRPSNRSRFLAFFMVASGLGRMAGDLVSPPIFEAGGMRSVAWTAAGAALLGAILIFTLVHEVERDTVRPPF